MKELAQKYYDNYTNKYYSNSTIKEYIKTLSDTQLFDFLYELIHIAEREAMKAQAEADYRVYNDWHKSYSDTKADRYYPLAVPKNKWNGTKQ